MKYYDDELKEAISNLPNEDKLKLLESFFDAMITAISTYLTNQEYSPAEIEQSIDDEVNNIKKIVLDRLEVLDAKHENEKLSAMQPMDDQMVNDAKIDLGLIIQEFGVKSM